MEWPMPFFPWGRLPLDLQKSILSLLPVSTLILCTTVSRSWRSLIHSDAFASSYPSPTNPNADEVFFLFFSVSYTSAYDPSRDHWISLPIPDDIISFHASDGSLLMAELSHGGIIVFNPFTRFFGTRPIPPMNSKSHPYTIALITKSLSEFKIVAVSTADRVYSQIYDSRTDEWELKGEFPGKFAVIGNTAYLDGLLYCLSRGPDHLLTFDPTEGEWNLLDVRMPPVVCSHLLVLDGGLFLLGAVEEDGVIARVGIWELNRSKRMEWKDVCFMPDEVFHEFSEGGLNRFETSDRKGKIIFYNTLTSTVLVCDWLVKRWWCPWRGGSNTARGFWLGHALEPHIDLVKQLVQR